MKFGTKFVTGDSPNLLKFNSTKSVITTWRTHEIVTWKRQGFKIVCSRNNRFSKIMQLLNTFFCMM